MDSIGSIGATKDDDSVISHSGKDTMNFFNFARWVSQVYMIIGSPTMR